MSATVTTASTGTGTHEVLQVALPAEADGDDAVTLVANDYLERHGHLPDGATRLAREPLPDGRFVFTVLVYTREGEDPS